MYVLFWVSQDRRGGSALRSLIRTVYTKIKLTYRKRNYGGNTLVMCASVMVVHFHTPCVITSYDRITVGGKWSAWQRECLYGWNSNNYRIQRKPKVINMLSVCLYCLARLYTYFLSYSELYYLIYWENTNEVSVHEESEIKEPAVVERTVGTSCMVCYRRKLYEGSIACTGKYCVRT